MNPLISIIVPIYNADKYLQRCLDSLISQSYDQLEIILIDDGSTDSSPHICDEYEKKDFRIKVIHKINTGVSEARNIGLNIASGDYIHFVDADDWVEPLAYRVLADTLNKYEHVDIIRFNAYNSSNNIVNDVPYRGVYNGAKLEEVVLNYIGSPKLGGMFILGVPWLYLFSRKLVDEYKIRFNKNLRRCEDRLFTLTALLQAQSVTFIEDVLYHYETNTGSLSNKYDSIRWSQERLYLNELRKEYRRVRNKEFIQQADNRISTEYVLRAMVSVNNEFFSDNDNHFSKRYCNTKLIVSDPLVKEASMSLKKEKLGIKGDLIVFLITHQCSLLLSALNMMIVYKNKIAR